MVKLRLNGSKSVLTPACTLREKDGNHRTALARSDKDTIVRSLRQCVATGPFFHTRPFLSVFLATAEGSLTVGIGLVV